MSDLQRPGDKAGAAKAEQAADPPTIGKEPLTERRTAARQIQRSIAAWGNSAEVGAADGPTAGSSKSHTATVVERLQRMVKRKPVDGEATSSEQSVDSGDVTTVQRMPKWNGGDGDDDGDPRNARGARGESFRGGKKKDRDQWFGLETKPDFEAFKLWWHRVGKQGKDLTCKADADKAYEAFKADKTKPK